MITADSSTDHFLRTNVSLAWIHYLCTNVSLAWIHYLCTKVSLAWIHYLCTKVSLAWIHYLCTKVSLAWIHYLCTNVSLAWIHYLCTKVSPLNYTMSRVLRFHMWTNQPFAFLQVYHDGSLYTRRTTRVSVDKISYIQFGKDMQVRFTDLACSD